MALNVVWSEYAANQLKEIFYYHSSVGGVRIARRLVNKITDRVEMLQDNPRAGQKEELLKEYSEEFRYLVEGNYKIIYRIENHEVIISSVFDSRQNPIKMHTMK